MRLPRTLALAAMVGSTLTAGVVGAAAPAAGNGGIWCSQVAEGPCVESIEVEGFEPVTQPGQMWDVEGYSGTNDPEPWYQVDDMTWVLRAQVVKFGNPDIGADRPLVTITMSMDQVTPLVVLGHGSDLRTTRSTSDPMAKAITVSGRPVAMTGSCSGSIAGSDLQCPEWEGDPGDDQDRWSGRFDLAVGNGLVIEDDSPGDLAEKHVPIRASALGLDIATDAAAGSLPPTLSLVSAPRLDVPTGNRRYDSSGDLVRGRTSVFLPEEFLRLGLGIPDPASLRTTGLAAALRGNGKGDLAVTRDGTGMRVTATGVTYPRTVRTLGVEVGTITPTKPKRVDAKRVKKRKGVVRFVAAKPRGAEVTGYKAVCKAKGARHKVKGTSTGRTKVVVKKLKPRTPYVCKVRATSDFGNGKWSRKDRLKPRP